MKSRITLISKSLRQFVNTYASKLNKGGLHNKGGSLFGTLEIVIVAA